MTFKKSAPAAMAASVAYHLRTDDEVRRAARQKAGAAGLSAGAA